MLLAGFLLSLNACVHIKLRVYELLITEASIGPYCKTGYEKADRGVDTVWLAPNEIPNTSKAPSGDRERANRRPL